MTAVPYGYQKYIYVPCDTPQNSIQNFNIERSQPNQNPSAQNDKGGFVEEANPNTRQGQTELPPIVTHTEVQHAIMHEITNQVNEQPNYTNWIFLGLGLVAFFIVIAIISGGRRSDRRIRDYTSPSTTPIERRTFETNVRQSDGTTQQITTETPLDDNLLNMIKTQYPRDYIRILKWVAKYPEDVKIILQNSEDYREGIRQMVRKARDEQDWSDLK